MESNQTSEPSFFSDILQPGSSLNPTFLLILDSAFALLLIVLLSLAYLTSGNFHIFALTSIELALWATVKWRVSLLQLMIQRITNITTGLSMSSKIHRSIIQRWSHKVRRRSLKNDHDEVAELRLVHSSSTLVAFFIPTFGPFCTFLRQRKHCSRVSSCMTVTLCVGSTHVLFQSRQAPL